MMEIKVKKKIQKQDYNKFANDGNFIQNFIKTQQQKESQTEQNSQEQDQ